MSVFSLKFTTLLFSILILPISLQSMTPLEKSGYSKLTSYPEMVSFLQELDAGCPFLTVKNIGSSVECRSIPALFFSISKKFSSGKHVIDKKPTLLIYCQQHGNEPAGKEAALMLAEELAFGSFERFRSFNLIIIPMLNPDGNESNRRKNSADVDLNRDHAALTQPETQSLHALFRQYLPEITLDVHEYTSMSKEWVEQGVIKDADIMMEGGTNPNIDRSLIDYTRNTILPEMETSLAQKSLRFHRYIVGDPFGNNHIRYSTAAVNDGRQSFGFFGTFSFLLEGKKYSSHYTYIEKRTASQLSALKSFLDIVEKHGKTMRNIVKKVRHSQEIPFNYFSRLAHIQMDYTSSAPGDSLEFPLFDLYDWEPITRPLPNFQPHLAIEKSVSEPLAYIFPAEMNQLIETLELHGFKVLHLSGTSDIKLEKYDIAGISGKNFEDSTVPAAEVTSVVQIRRLPQNTCIVYLDQLGGDILPLLLEPQSSFNIFQDKNYRRFQPDYYPFANGEYPIYRLIEPVELGFIENK